jgi:hypothetical protein
MKSTGAERDIVRGFVAARIEVGNFTRDGGNEILDMIREAGDSPILPTTPPPKPPAGRAELNAAARIVELAGECETSGITPQRLSEIFAYALTNAR